MTNTHDAGTATESAKADRRASSDHRDVPTIWLSDRTESENKKAWDDYWEQLNDRQPIFELEALDFVDRFTAAFPDTSNARVLDFGCGFGLLSAAISAHVGQLNVWDSAANMRRIAYQRLSNIDNISFIDLSENNQDAYEATHDIILVNSVIQYMTLEDLREWMVQWKSILKTDGRLVISDIMTPDYKFFRDVMSYLYLCMRRGVLIRSIRAGLKEISNYSSVKTERPLLKLDRAAIADIASGAGMRVDILDNNLTYHHGRMTAVFAATDRSTG